jgi:hypothetical protein
MMSQRPNAIGWSLVLFFLIGGIAFWITIPDIFIGQIWVVVALGLGALYLFMNRGASKMDELKRTGAPGTATIQGMTQTGVYVNEQPQVRLKLHIQASGMEPYEMEKTLTVPMIALGRLGSGQPLTVFVDRQDREKIAIDWFGGGGAGAAPFTVQSAGGAPVNVGDASTQQAVMQALHEHGVDPSSGEVDLRQMPEAREAVLKALKEHGVDAAHAAAAANPATTVSDQGNTGEPLERLTKLMQLKSAQLITDEEFAEQRKRILGEV